MIDFSDHLKGKDIHFQKTGLYKVRNVLKTMPGENPYYPKGGINLTELYRSPSTGTQSATQNLAKELFSQYCDISSFEISKKRGLLEVGVVSQTEEL